LTPAIERIYAAAYSRRPSRGCRAEDHLTTLQHLSPIHSHQVRLRLQRATVARLLDLQGRFVAAGLPKPSYSDLIDAIVADLDDAPDVVRRLQGDP
jgi:hypothetical protein